MTRLLLINLIISLCLGYLSYVASLPNVGKIAAYKELIKCTHAQCEEQNIALKALFKDELDKCLKKCNAGDRKLNTLEEEERKKLRECFKENGCKLPMEHIKQNHNTPQFKALKECAEKNCKSEFDKIKSLESSLDNS